MAPIATLSTGVIPRIMNGEQVDKPVLQILGIKRISGNDSDRFRLLTSDGKYFNSYAMLATNLNHMQADGKLAEYTIVRVDKYLTSVVNRSDAGKRVLIMLELTVLNSASEVGRKIGEPVSYTEAGALEPSTTSSASSTASINAGSGGGGGGRSNGISNGSSSSTTTAKPGLFSVDVSLNGTINTQLTVPISSLSPYQNRWVIKARVTSKSNMRSWSNAKGEGKLFSMDLMDESGEIRATAFREQAEKFYDQIQVDHVYYITKCQLKPANKTYTTINNDYEMTMTSETLIQECMDEDVDMPAVKYNFVPIAQIANLEPKSMLDVIGVCKEVGQLQAFTARSTNRELKKRELTLVDTSNAAVTLTLWNEDAANFEENLQPVVLIKSGRITEFNGGKSISTGSGTVLKINPDIPECHKLRGWYDNGGAEGIDTLVSARTGGGGGFNSEWLTFHEARAKGLGNGDKPDYFQCKAVVHIVKTDNAYYKACPQDNCNKKVVDDGNGHFHCERCSINSNNFKYRLLINMSIGDWTSNRWVTCFSEVGEQLLKHSSQEIGEALENDPSAAEGMFAAVNFSAHIFKLRVKSEVYGDVPRTRLTVQSVAPINYKEYNKYLINNIREVTGIHKANV